MRGTGTWKGRVLLAAAAVVLLCGTASAQIELLHISNSSHGAGWYTFLRERAEAFHALNPDIRVEVVQSGSYVDRVTTMILGGQPPDVTDFAPHHAVLIARDDGFHDLRRFMADDADFDRSSIIDVAFAPVTSPEGVVWGLPMDIYPLVTYYNIDLFELAGLATPNDLSPDEWTWDQAV